MALAYPYSFVTNIFLYIKSDGTSDAWTGPPFVKIYIKSKDFREPIIAKITQAFIMGTIIGMMTRIEVWNLVAPSTWAASMISGEIDFAAE